MYPKFGHCKGVVLTLLWQKFKNKTRRQETGVQRAALRLLLLSVKNGKFYISGDSRTTRKGNVVQGKAFGSDEVSAIASEVFNT